MSAHPHVFRWSAPARRAASLSLTSVTICDGSCPHDQLSGDSIHTDTFIPCDDHPRNISNGTYSLQKPVRLHRSCVDTSARDSVAGHLARPSSSYRYPHFTPASSKALAAAWSPSSSYPIRLRGFSYFVIPTPTMYVLRCCLIVDGSVQLIVVVGPCRNMILLGSVVESFEGKMSIIASVFGNVNPATNRSRWRVPWWWRLLHVTLVWPHSLQLRYYCSMSRRGGCLQHLRNYLQDIQNDKVHVDINRRNVGVSGTKQGQACDEHIEQQPLRSGDEGPFNQLEAYYHRRRGTRLSYLINGAGTVTVRPDCKYSTI